MSRDMFSHKTINIGVCQENELRFSLFLFYINDFGLFCLSMMQKHGNNITSSIDLLVRGGWRVLNRLFVVQKFSLGSIIGLGYRESCRIRFWDSSILTLPGLYLLKCVLFLKKHPEYFHDLLEKKHKALSSMPLF